ncbi:MAG: hypothetical protein ACRDNL_25870, partial [Spirillospora sp.]
MTAGATVLGIAAMSGVSHAETSQPSAKQAARPFKSVAPKKEPPKTALKTKTITPKKATTPKKTVKKAETGKGAAAKTESPLSLRLAPTLKYDEPSRTASVGLDLGVGLGSKDNGLNVRVGAGVNASLGGGGSQGNRT